MGTVCCYASNKKKASDLKIVDRSQSSGLGEEMLKQKIDFQLQWEGSHSTIQDTQSVWKLAYNIGDQDINKFYDIQKNSSIGNGHYGTVHRCRLKTDPGKLYAVKSIEKNKLKGNLNILRNEFEILRSCDHPNINQFYEIFQDHKYFHFVLEYCEGGDITTRVEKYGAMDESSAKVIIYQTLMAISHLHSCGIIHRDIKPDNFLFKNRGSTWPIKLIDFGLSKKLPSNGKVTSFLGTPYYVAPEILEKHPYDLKADSWSVGVMLYLILSAKFPFQGRSNQQTFDMIKNKSYSMSASDGLIKLSLEGKNFMSKLLEKNPQKRLSIVEALRDPWFNELSISLIKRGRESFPKDVLQNLRSFSSESTLVKEVIRLLVMIHDDTPEIARLKDAFFYLDALNLGILNVDELRKAFSESGMEIDDSELHKILHSLELRITNVLTFTEFASACVNKEFYTNKAYLTEVFNRFDVGHDGFISYSDISCCFSRFGVDLPRTEIMSIISDGDTDKDGRISFEEFVEVMSKDIHRSDLPPLRKVPDDAIDDDHKLHKGRFHSSQANK